MECEGRIREVGIEGDGGRIYIGCRSLEREERKEMGGRQSA